MPVTATLTAWFLVMFPLVYSPGPANTLFASNGAKFGFRRQIGFSRKLHKIVEAWI